MDNLDYKKKKPTRIITLANAEIDFKREIDAVNLEHLYPVYVTATNGSYQAPTTIPEGGEITVTIAPSTNYVLPDEVTVTGASQSYNSGTGVITITEPEDAVYVSAVCLAQYSVSAVVTNGSSSGDALIVEGKTASVTIVPIEGYELPEEISLVGASYSYNDSTGVVSLSNPTGNVAIVAICPKSISPILANNSWEDIRAVCEAGNASAYWSLGDTKTDVGTDSTTRTFRICDMQGLYGKHVVFEQVELEASTAVWNPSDNLDDDNCYNDYNISNMRTTVLPALLANYSSGLSGQITNTTYKVAKNGNSSTILDLTDKLFLPAEKEIFGSQTYSRIEEASALTWFALYQANNTDAFRIKYIGSTATRWWERSPRSGDTGIVCCVNDGGGADDDYANGSRGVSPCFAF